MWIEDLASYIRSQNIPGVGQNVYIFTMRAGEAGAMITTHQQGVLAVNEIPEYYKGGMQLVVREPTARQALVESQAISDLLSSNVKRMNGQPTGLTLPTVDFHYINPRHLPVVFPRSQGDYYECSVNFDVCFVAVLA